LIFTVVAVIGIGVHRPKQQKKYPAIMPTRSCL
jgi:hypothetical protein